MSDEHLSRDALLAMLRQDEQAVVAAVKALPPGAMEEGVYEEGWNRHQLLAHLAAIEWTYPRLIALAMQPIGEGAAPEPSPRHGMDGYNAREVARRADVLPDDLLAEFRTNRAATIAAVEALNDDILARPVRSAGGREGSLLEVLHGVAVDHVRTHLADLQGFG